MCLLRASDKARRHRSDHPTGIIEPVETDAEDGNGKGQDQDEQDQAYAPPDGKRLAPERARPVEPQGPDRDGEHRQAAEHDAEQWAGRRERLDDIDAGDRDEDGDEKDESWVATRLSRLRGRRRAPSP